VKGRQRKDGSVLDHRRELAVRARQIFDDGEGDKAAAGSGACLRRRGEVGDARCRGRHAGGTRLSGQGRALARPVTCQGALTECLARFLASLGELVPANAKLWRARAGYRRCPGAM
jgi:hypothetical protein